MKLMIVVLVLGALLLQDFSIDAFQQSSNGYLNTLTWTLPKSTPMPMPGYLNSLGNTASTFKDQAPPTYLPPRYEAEYPRRHDFSKEAVSLSPSGPFASTAKQSDPVSLHSSSKVSTGSGTSYGGTSICQYGQSTSPSELLGDAYMNMMGAAELATSVPSEENKPEPSTKKEVPVAKDTPIGKEAAATPRNPVSVETKIVEAPELATMASTTFDGYHESLTKTSSEVVVPTSAKIPVAHTVDDTPKTRNDDHAVPAAAEMVKVPTTATADTLKPVSSLKLKPKPNSASTPFDGYIGSLTKASSEVVVPVTSNMLEARINTTALQAPAPRLDTAKLQSDESLAEPKAISTSVGGTNSSDKESGWESPSHKGGVSEKPKRIPVTGYLGSLKQKLSESGVSGAPVVASSQTKKDNGSVPAKLKATPMAHSGYLDSLMTPKFPIEDLPCKPDVASSQTRQGNGAAAHAPFVSLEKSKANEEKLAAKIDFVPKTRTQRPSPPLADGGPAQLGVVEGRGLLSWAKVFRAAEEAWEGSLTMNLEGRLEPLEQFWNFDSMKAMTETFVSKFKTNIESDMIIPKSASKFKSTETKPAIDGESNDIMSKSESFLTTFQGYFPSLAEMSSEVVALADAKVMEAHTAVDTLKLRADNYAVSAVAEIVKAHATITADIPKPVSSTKPQTASTPFDGYIGSLAKASSEVVALAAAKVLEAHTAVDTSKLRADNHAVPAAAEIVKARAATTADIPKPVASAKPEPKSFSTIFHGYILSLAETSSEVVALAAAKVLEAHTAVDTSKLRADNHAVPAAAEIVKAHAATTADIPKPVASAKPKPKSASTPFGGYIGSLTKASVVGPSQAKKDNGAVAHVPFFEVDEFTAAGPKVVETGDVSAWVDALMRSVEEELWEANVARPKVLETGDLPAWVDALMRSAEELWAANVAGPKVGETVDVPAWVDALRRSVEELWEANVAGPKVLETGDVPAWVDALMRSAEELWEANVAGPKVGETVDVPAWVDALMRSAEELWEANVAGPRVGETVDVPAWVDALMRSAEELWEANLAQTTVTAFEPLKQLLNLDKFAFNVRLDKSMPITSNGESKETMPKLEAKEKVDAPEESLPADGKMEEMIPQLEEETKEVMHTVGTTESIMRNIPAEGQAGGLGGASFRDAFVKIEENWSKAKASEPFTYDSKLQRKDQNGISPPPQFVAEDRAFESPRCWAKLQDSQNKELDYDVVVVGGTLGVFFATALQLKGHRVCVLEAGNLQGREQESNISMDELLELIKVGVLTQEDVDEAIATEFRLGFKNREVTPTKWESFANGVGYECETPDVLNLGVAPDVLLERVVARFKGIGGIIKEETRLKGVVVLEMIGTAMDLGDESEPVTARVVLDYRGKDLLFLANNATVCNQMASSI